MIDSAWFYQQLEGQGRSVRDLARFLDLDPSSVSRMLRGERKMSAEEQDGIAAYLGLSLGQIASRRRGEADGFAERGQEPLVRDEKIAPSGRSEGQLVPLANEGFGPSDRRRDKTSGAMAHLPGDGVSGAPEKSYYETVRGCMKGTITIAPGVDLTEPTDPEWARVYDD